MNSKTLLFNKSIMKSDVRRFWWIPALESIGIFITCVLPVIYSSLPSLMISEEWAYTRFTSTIYTSVIWVVMASVGMAIMLFSYLNSAGAVSCLHGMPVKRSTMYFSHIVTGLALLLLPVLINSLIFCILKMTMLDINYLVKFYFLGKWIWCFALYTLVVFSGTVLVCMLTGNSIASLVISGIFALVPAFLLMFADFFLGQNLYGYYSQNLQELLKYIYITPEMLMSVNCLIYIIGGGMLLTLSGLLYKIRSLENHGEVLAFTWFKPIFVICAAICSGMLGYAYFCGITGALDISTILIMLPFGLVGLVIAFMVARRSFSLKGILKYVVMYAVFVVAVYLGVKFDITGYEKRLPDIDKIASVTIINDDELSTYSYTDNGEKVYYEQTYDPQFTDIKDIENVLALHRFEISQKYSTDAGINVVYIPIIYTLKDGSKMYRAYKADYEADREVLAPLMESSVYKAFRFPITDGTEKTNNSITINIFSNSEASTSDRNLIEEISSAIEKDIAGLKYDDYIWTLNNESEPPLSIDIYYTKKVIRADGNVAVGGNEQDTYYITDKYTNTLEVLEKYHYNTSLDFSNVTMVGINIYEYNDAQTEYSYDESAQTAADNQFQDTFTLVNQEIDGQYYTIATNDSEIMNQVVMYAENAYKNKIYKNERVEFGIYIYIGGDVKSPYFVNLIFGYEDMPQVFQDLLNMHYSHM